MEAKPPAPDRAPGRAAVTAFPKARGTYESTPASAQRGVLKMNRERAAHYNRATVLLLISTRGAVSPAQIAKLTQLRRSTVHYVLRDLMNCGLVCQGETLESKRVGPKETLIEMAPKAAWAAGLSLSPHGHRLCLLNAAGQIIAQQTLHSSTPIPDFFTDFKDILGTLAQRYHLRKEAQLGLTVCLPGIVNRNTGYVLNSDSLNVRNLALGDYLQARFNCPVIVERNAICGAYAERYAGGLLGTEQFLYLLTRPEPSPEPTRRRYSFGLAIINDGEVYRGWNSAAGEFHGSLMPEGMPQEFSIAGSPAHQAAEARRFVSALGTVIGGLVNLLDPQFFVVAGDDELWSTQNLQIAQAASSKVLTPIPNRVLTITRSKLGLDGVVLGAALICLHQGLRERLATAERNGWQ